MDAQAELMILRDRTEAGESFAELAQEHSEDIVSAAAGGELGAVAAGVFDADYDRVLWALNEGEVSQPVQTELGYHLIKLEICFGLAPIPRSAVACCSSIRPIN